MTNIEAMKLALDAQERAWLWMENQADGQSKGGHATFDLMVLREERDALQESIAALRQQISEAEQEPVAGFETWWQRDGQEFLYALNTTTDDDIKLVAEFAWNAAPPQREWVSLTDDEIAHAVGSPIDEVYLADFRAIEAKLKEKNT